MSNGLKLRYKFGRRSIVGELTAANHKRSDASPKDIRCADGTRLDRWIRELGLGRKQ